MTVMSISHESLSLSQRCKVHWQSLAYRNQAAEWMLYALLLTGLPMMTLFDTDWSWQRWDMVVHALLGTFGFSLVVVPFWLSHRRLLQRSRKPFLRITGRLTEMLLLITGVTGYYLIVWGNRGSTADYLIHETHLYAAMALTLVLMRHAFRWSVLQPLWKRLLRTQSPA